MSRSRRLALVMALAAALACGQARADAALPPVRHVFLFVLENRSFNQTFGSLSPAKYLAWTLPGMGAFIPNYYGVTHESLGNYIAMISGQGSNPQTQADCQYYTDVLPGTVGSDGQAAGTGCVYPAEVPTLARQLSAKGLTWKGYMEDMGNAQGQPQTCRHPALGAHDDTQSARNGDQYAARHNPFVYFHSIIDTPACAQDNVPLDRLPGDLASASTTPNFAFITPNLCDDGHDAPCVDGRPGGLVSADAFLRAWVPRIVASPAFAGDGLLIVLFDENDSSDAAACCGEPQFPNTVNNGGPVMGSGGGQVGAVAISPYIDPGTLDTVAYNHFSLLRSVEDLFGLAPLGYAAQDGLPAFGSDLFTCYRPVTPTARGGRLAPGSEIKVATIGQGTAPRPSALVKLWAPGTAIVQIPGRHHRLRTVARQRSQQPCQLLTLPLPRGHGTAFVTARAFGGAERRTLSF